METGERTATGAADDGEDKEQDALQEHLLLLLADSNLPTGLYPTAPFALLFSY